MRRTWPAEQGKQNKVLTEPHGVLLCCAHICQSPSADSCDTSHLVFETRLQLSLTGTPASISVSRRSSRGSRHAGSSDLTAVFCLLPEGLRAQWDKGTNIMFCVGAAPVCRKRSILPHLFLLCCFCVDLNQADGISSTFTLWLDCLLVDVVWSKSWLNLSRNYNLYSLVFYEFMFFCEIQIFNPWLFISEGWWRFLSPEDDIKEFGAAVVSSMSPFVCPDICQSFQRNKYIFINI